MKHRPVKWRDRREHRIAQIQAHPEQRAVNKMTNWQRSRWARAGYPKDRVLYFSTIGRRETRALIEEMLNLTGYSEVKA